MNAFYNLVEKAGMLSEFTKKQLIEIAYDDSGDGETKKELNAKSKSELVKQILYDEFETYFE